MASNADNQRMVGDLLRLGTIASVDHEEATCRVQLGDITSGDLPWLAMRAGGTRAWSPPTVGEQVLVFSPEADLAAGIVLPGIYSDASPAPWSDKDAVGTMYADGAYVAYDAKAHELVAILPGGGTALIEAPGGVTIRGDLKVEGEITATKDVKADTISLKSHQHLGVQPGGGTSGAPKS